MFTSAPWFLGFATTIRVRGIEALVRPIEPARTWLLAIGWRRHGRLGLDELPSTA